jgi:hypothetical protein
MLIWFVLAGIILLRSTGAVSVANVLKKGCLAAETSAASFASLSSSRLWSR